MSNFGGIVHSRRRKLAKKAERCDLSEPYSWQNGNRSKDYEFTVEIKAKPSVLEGQS
jgi:hypothetical protein